MNVALRVIDVKNAQARRTGKFVVEFGDQTAIGISGAEVAELLDSERHAHAKVYKIHRAYPDGRMELVGVDRSRLRLEDCFLFWRTDASAARADFEALRTSAAGSPPPCRARVHLAEVPSAARPHVVAMLYPAEYGDEMSGWLLAIGYQGGDIVEAGAGDAGGYVASEARVIERVQFWGTQDGTLAESGRVVQAVES